MAQKHGVRYENAPPSAVALKLAGKPRHAKDLQTLEDLKPWHCVALAKHMAYGMALSDAAREVKHSPDTLRAVATSPAGAAFLAKVEAELKDPVKLVKELMKSDTFELWVKWRAAFDWAYEAKDAELVHKMAKDIGLQPALEDKESVGPTKISLHLNLNDLAAPVASSTFSIVEDAEYTVQDPADDSQGLAD